MFTGYSRLPSHFELGLKVQLISPDVRVVSGASSTREICLCEVEEEPETEHITIKLESS
jgi:hypothetical protein